MQKKSLFISATKELTLAESASISGGDKFTKDSGSGLGSLIANFLCFLIEYSHPTGYGYGRM